MPRFIAIGRSVLDSTQQNEKGFYLRACQVPKNFPDAVSMTAAIAKMLNDRPEPEGRESMPRESGPLNQGEQA